MGTINRGSKAAGGQSFVDDTDILASEVNTDFDRLYTLVNGNIDSTNISSSAAIPNSALAEIDGTKVADHADNASTYETRTSAGDTATPSLPTDLEEEHERIRYRIERAGRYASAQYTDSDDTNQTVSWTEPPIQGGNLLVNSGFEGADPAGNAPYGWTEEGTLTDSELAAAAAANGLYARHLTLTGDTSTGISQTVSGLKASTKYLFGCVYVRTAGTVLIETTGGLAAGNDYQDSSVSDNSTSASLQTVNMIVQTTGTPADIDFRIMCGANSTDFDVVEAWCYELNDSRPADTPTGLMQTATHNTAETLPSTFTGSQWNWEVVGELDIAQ